MKNFQTALRALNTLQSYGLTFSDICRIVNFAELMKLADKFDLTWLKLLITVTQSLCSLAPDKQKAILDLVDTIDIDQLA